MEVEVKFRIDFDETKRKIESLGAVFVREELQEDIYFSLPLPKLLRVRKITNLGKAFITYKEIRDPGKNEEFDELEFDVSDGDKAIELFRRLGFEEDCVVRKRRLVYKLDGVTFELNDVEGLGEFLDIEVISKDVEEAKRKIWEIAKLLGLGEKDVEPKLYQELIRNAEGRKKERA